MSTRTNIWVGFGILTSLLLFFGVAILLNVHTLQGDVVEQAEVARPRSAAAREMEINLLGYALAVRTYLHLRDERFAQAASVQSRAVESSLTEYTQYARSERQRALAGQFSQRWQTYRALAESLVARGDADRAESERLVYNRIALEALLDSEIQREAVASYDRSKAATFQDLRHIRWSILLLLLSVPLIALPTAVFVSRGVLSTERALAAESAQLRALNLHLETRVKQRTVLLTEANQELQAFTYTVSHDLRAPLRGIQGFARALAEDFPADLNATARDYCSRIVAAADRMENLIDDLLAYSRLAREELVLVPLELESVVDSAHRSLSAEIERTGAVIEVRQPLGAVKAQRAILTQVCTNLLANAIKFVQRGERPSIQIYSEPLDGRIRLVFEDRGIGVEARDVDRIFQVFERLHGDDAYPGTGIGLAIVKRGIERMGGRCGAESAPGAGSRFWIELEQV